MRCTAVLSIYAIVCLTMYETKIDINALHVSQMTVTAPDMSLCDDYSDDLHYVLFSWLRKNVT